MHLSMGHSLGNSSKGFRVVEKGLKSVALGRVCLNKGQGMANTRRAGVGLVCPSREGILLLMLLRIDGTWW